MRGVVTGTQPGRPGRGLVRGRGRRGREERLVHLLGAVGDRAARARGRGGGLQRHLAAVTRSRARLPVLLPRRAGGERLRRPTSTTSTRTAGVRRARSACSSHYDAVIWYTGDDVITRDAGHGAGHGVASGERRAARHAPVHRRGRPAAVHRQVCRPPVRPGLRVRPRAWARVRPEHGRRRLPGSCRTTSCSTTWARTSTTTTPARRRTAASTTSWASRIRSRACRGPSAGRARTTRTTARRSSRPAGSCPSEKYPQFDSSASAKYVRPGGPFDPHTGHLLRVLADRGCLVQAPDADDRPDRAGEREPVVLDLARHRAGLGLRVRRGPYGRPGRLDDAA